MPKTSNLCLELLSAEQLPGVALPNFPQQQNLTLVGVLKNTILLAAWLADRVACWLVGLAGWRDDMLACWHAASCNLSPLRRLHGGGRLGSWRGRPADLRELQISPC